MAVLTHFNSCATACTQTVTPLAQPHGPYRCPVWPSGYTGGWCKSCIDSTRRCVASSSSCRSASLAGCGNTWIGHASEASEQPAGRGGRARRHRPRTSSRCPTPTARSSSRSSATAAAARRSSTRSRRRWSRYRQRFDYKFVLMAGDNIYEGPATRGRLSAEVRGAVQAAARRRRQVLRRARQPRRHQPDLLQAVQHGRPSLLHVRAAGRSDHAAGTRACASSRSTAPISTSSRSRWFEKELTESRAEWKIAFLHHPLYTSGRYTLAARGIRLALESAFVNGGVDVVFSGHEHIYQRAELQHGILYFITGGAGSLRAGRRGAVAADRAQLRPGLSLHAGGDLRRWVFLPGDQSPGRDGRRGLAAAAYCGHDGPSVICFTLALKTRTHSATGVAVRRRTSRSADRSARCGTDPSICWSLTAATAARRGVAGRLR